MKCEKEVRYNETDKRWYEVGGYYGEGEPCGGKYSLDVEIRTDHHGKLGLYLKGHCTKCHSEFRDGWFSENILGLMVTKFVEEYEYA